MKFSEFYETSRDVAVLEIEAIRLNWKGKKSSIPVMLHRWEKEDKIIKLKNGLYIFSEKYRRKEILGINFRLSPFFPFFCGSLTGR